MTARALHQADDPRPRAVSLDIADQTAVDRVVGWFWRNGRVILGEALEEQDAYDSDCWTGYRTAGALTIAQTCPYDPGNQAYRFHSAINQATPHASLFVRSGNDSPYCNYRQLDMWADREVATVAVATADVVHCHMSLYALSYLNVRWRGQLVVHFHGSDAPGQPKRLVNYEMLKRWNALAVGARLDHGEYGDLPWVPMAQPVPRLARLRQMYRRPGQPGIDRPLRIAHSPTWRGIKGTEVFLAVCDGLRAQGVAVEPVLIEGHRHHDALAWKATCDACFDSFWLGIQGSGLEAGAMAIPVLAGDARTQRLYVGRVGYCPYTFTPDPVALEDAIVALIEDPAFYARESARVRAYVTEYHSYARVAGMYLQALAFRAPQLADRIVAAWGTLADRPTGVVPMRPSDDYPWLADDAWRPVPRTTPRGWARRAD